MRTPYQLPPKPLGLGGEIFQIRCATPQVRAMTPPDSFTGADSDAQPVRRPVRSPRKNRKNRPLRREAWAAVVGAVPAGQHEERLQEPTRRRPARAGSAAGAPRRPCRGDHAAAGAGPLRSGAACRRAGWRCACRSAPGDAPVMLWWPSAVSGRRRESHLAARSASRPQAAGSASAAVRGRCSSARARTRPASWSPRRRTSTARDPAG